MSLTLALLMLFAMLPCTALSAGPRVEMSYTCPDAQPMVGSQVTFSLTGEGCEAYKLMVVTPDSKQHFYDGPQPTVTLGVPGLHVFVGYGTDDATPGAAGNILCMTQQVWITAGGTAASGTIEGLALTANTTPLPSSASSWQPLDGQTFYDPEIQVKLTVSEPLPEDAQVTLKWKIGNASETMVDVPAGAGTEWIGSIASVLPDWVLEVWKVHSMSVEGCIRLPDGTEKNISADFKLDTYTNEMRYINQFLGENGQWSSSEKGRALVKWLSIYERDLADRANSGYLQLQEVAVNHIDGAYKWGNATARAIMFTADTISAFGTNLLADAALYTQMFGSAGKDALPYYAMLSSTYTDYISTLMAEMADVQAGAEILASLEGVDMDSSTFTKIFDTLAKTADTNAANSVIKRLVQRSNLTAVEEKYLSKLYAYLQKNPEAVATGLGAAATAGKAIDFFSNNAYESDLQKAYFSVYATVTDEYVNALLVWQKALENSDVPNAKAIRAALNALINDILSTRDSALASAQKNFNLLVKRSGDLVSLVSDTIDTSINIIKLFPWIKKTTTATAASKFFTGADAVVTPASFISVVGGLITGGYLDYDTSIKSTYYTTWALSDQIIAELERYQQTPTDVQARRIIQLLGLIRQMKYYGEDLVMMHYLGKMFDAYDITEGPTMTILFNELEDYHQGAMLKAEDHATTVRLVLENTVLGTKQELKETGNPKFEKPENFSGLFGITTGSDVVLGATVRGIYRLDQTPVNFQGYRLPQVTADVLTLPDSRDSARKPIAGNRYIWFVGSPTLHAGWPHFRSAFTPYMYTETGILYSHNGIELLLTMDEYRAYIHSQTDVNLLLADPRYNRDDSPESTEKQYVQHLLWHKITKGYIESLDMYDPDIQYRND